MTSKIYPVSEVSRANTHINFEQYQTMYHRSLHDIDAFWAEQANEFLLWEKPFSQVCKSQFDIGEAQWFADGKLNVSENCIDRHLPKRAHQTAIIWEGDNADESEKISYQQLHDRVCALANALKSRGIKRGDRVCIYLPMIPEAAYAMLACTRIGAIHSLVFAGFSPEALKDRILDLDCKMIITADESFRGGKIIPLKNNVDKALEHCPNVETCIVVKRSGGNIQWLSQHDVWYHNIVSTQPTTCAIEAMNSEDPLFILYTSGSTGKPKGVLHTTAGYLLQIAMSFKYAFDYKEGEVFWCTADIGWVTGHSYTLYGPLANGATTLMFEGIPTYPTPARNWEICDKYQVNIFYTAPTAIRTLMGAGNEWVKPYSRQSIRLLGTVGEPINPEAWEWYYHIVGEGRCPIVDTWWQTETGGHMLTPLPGAIALKPGSATLPFFGVEFALLDADGKEISGVGAGNLVIKRSWPGQIRGIYGNQQRYVETYFSHYKGYYFTGDGAKRDEDGYYWITGRVDDVLNISGHRLGTAEIESALVLHPAVAEAAVVGFPHDIKGQGIYAYVTLITGIEANDDLRQALVASINTEIGPIAKPDFIQWAPQLPKTRSGKIMRRILRKIAENDLQNLGDTSTLADPQVIEHLISHRMIQS